MKYKIAYNADYGGFSLSDEAIRLLHKKKGKELYGVKGAYSNTYFFTKEPPQEVVDYLQERCDMTEEIDSFFRKYIWEGYPQRHDPCLIETIEELGEKASSKYSNIKIAEIDENSYRIDDYDGLETIVTPSMEQYIKIDSSSSSCD